MDYVMRNYINLFNIHMAGGRLQTFCNTNIRLGTARAANWLANRRFSEESEFCSFRHRWAAAAGSQPVAGAGSRE